MTHKQSMLIASAACAMLFVARWFPFVGMFTIVFAIIYSIARTFPGLPR